MENNRWVAMDGEGIVRVYEYYPERDGNYFVRGGFCASIAAWAFPTLTHENSPQRIKLEAE